MSITPTPIISRNDRLGVMRKIINQNIDDNNNNKKTRNGVRWGWE